MPKFRIENNATATIKETWLVEAASPAEGWAKVQMGDAEFLGDEVVGDEEGRQLYSIMDTDTGDIIHDLMELLAVEAAADEFEQ
jgi:hypothetical protein